MSSKFGSATTALSKPRDIINAWRETKNVKGGFKGKGYFPEALIFNLLLVTSRMNRRYEISIEEILKSRLTKEENEEIITLLENTIRDLRAML